MRSRFDEQLADLNKKLIEMGAMCEECISLAAKALKEGNPRISLIIERSTAREVALFTNSLQPPEIRMP